MINHDDVTCVNCGRRVEDHDCAGLARICRTQQYFAPSWDSPNANRHARDVLSERDAQLARLLSRVSCTKCTWVGSGNEAVSAFRGTAGWECPQCHYACKPPISAFEEQLATAIATLREATGYTYSVAPQEIVALTKVAADQIKTFHDGLHDATTQLAEARKLMLTAEASLRAANGVNDVLETRLREEQRLRRIDDEIAAAYAMQVADARRERDEARAKPGWCAEYFRMLAERNEWRELCDGERERADKAEKERDEARRINALAVANEKVWIDAHDALAAQLREARRELDDVKTEVTLLRNVMALLEEKGKERNHELNLANQVSTALASDLREADAVIEMTSVHGHYVPPCDECTNAIHAWRERAKAAAWRTHSTERKDS